MPLPHRPVILVGLALSVLALATAPADAMRGALAEGGSLVGDPMLAQQPLEIEEVLSAAFPTALTAAADGSAVAWVLDERGARNVWVAEAPEFVGRRLTSYEHDDGQAISDLQFALAGSTLVYTRGGAPNRSDELPNPLSVATGVQREVFAIDVGGGEPIRIGEGSGPLVAPGGEGLVFRRGGGLHYSRLPVGEDEDPVESRLVVAPRGGMGGVRWSPDGSRLLFVSNRGTHAFVGVVGLDGGSVQWIDPSVDSDAAAVWSPDGDRIAFVRVPARRRLVIFAAAREARPWSIRVADASTGVSEVVFTADEGPGSVGHGVAVVASPIASGGLIWAAGDRLVFPWERNGWTGLYSVPASGGDPIELAVGQFEVEQVALRAGGNELLVTSNQADIDRRHIWRVAVDGSAPARRLTDEGWIEWEATPLEDDGTAYFRSSGTVPGHAVVRTAGGEVRTLAPDAIPADYPSDRMVEPQQVVFSGADGMRIHAQLFVPAGLEPGERRPAVVFLHGGSRRQMLLGFHYIGYYHNAYAFNQALASHGTIVLAVNYRSGIGYGLRFREALDYGATGASEFNDVLGAGLYLRSRDDVDPERIGLWGGSYGGYLTALGLARASDLFAAGVDLHGVHDWNDGIRIFVPSYDPDEDTERLAFESSPNAWLDTWRSPVLLIHGDDDRNVFFSQTVYLVEQLRDRDVQVEQLVFPDEVHGFLLHRNWVRAYEAAIEFFDRTLGAR